MNVYTCNFELCPWSTVFLEKLIDVQLVNNFPAFLRSRFYSVHKRTLLGRILTT